MLLDALGKIKEQTIITSLIMMILGLLMLTGIIILNNPWWDTAHSFVKVIGGAA